MKALTLGAVLGLVWVVFGLPFAPVAGVLAAVVQPVTVAFAAGLLARPYLSRGKGWSR